MHEPAPPNGAPPSSPSTADFDPVAVQTAIAEPPPVVTESNLSSALPAEPAGVREAFMLGWSISELRGRISVAAPDRPIAAMEEVGDAVNGLLARRARVSDSLWRASQWRAAFDRVSLLQSRFGFNSAVDQTPFDPGDGIPAYLYPPGERSYSDWGVLRPDPPEKPVLPGFRLREASRRAINCLDLLYLDADGVLQGVDFCRRQNDLVAAVLASLDAPSAVDAPTPSTGAPQGEEPTAPKPEDLHQAALQLTDRALLLLVTWDAYLRESFYLDGWSQSDQNNLVAYEAGRAMSWLSWELSCRTLHHHSNAPQASSTGGATTSDLPPQWDDAFANRNISYLQHQLTVLGKALDDGADATSTAELGPEACKLQAVRRSLDFWQRAVRWLGEPERRHKHGIEEPSWEGLRQTLIAQTAIWQALIMGHEDLSSYPADRVAQRLLREATMEIEKVVAPQVSEVAGNVVKAAEEQINSVERTVLHGMQDIADSASEVLHQQLSSFFRRFWPFLVGIAVIAIIPLLAIGLQIGNQLSSLVTGLGSAITVALGSLGLARLSQQRADQATAFHQNVENAVNQARDNATTVVQGARDTIQGAQQDVQSSVTNLAPPGSLPAQVGGVILADARAVLQQVREGFERGFDQVESDLAGLGQAIGVSYPLIDYVIGLTQQTSPESLQAAAAERIGSAYDFLRAVVWTDEDRADEMMRVVRAAFGPLGLMAMAQASNLSAGSQPTPAPSQPPSVEVLTPASGPAPAPGSARPWMNGAKQVVRAFPIWPLLAVVCLVGMLSIGAACLGGRVAGSGGAPGGSDTAREVPSATTLEGAPVVHDGAPVSNRERSPIGSPDSAERSSIAPVEMHSARPELPVEGEWFEIGRSVEGRAINAIRLGSGSVHLALVGSIHGGWERNTQLLVTRFYEYFRADPSAIPSGITLYIVPSTNPDGIARGADRDSAWNAHGVDLNRNFDTPNWSPDSFGRAGGRYGPTGTRVDAGGPAPFSEPETLAIREFVMYYAISAVLSYHSGIVSVTDKDGGGIAAPLAKRVAEITGYPYVERWTEYELTGQFMDWLDSVHVQGVEIDLPDQQTLDWEQNLAAVKAVMAMLIER